MTALQAIPDSAPTLRAPDAAGYRISALTDRPSLALRTALDDMLLEYYGVIIQKLEEAGFAAPYSPEGLKSSFWPNLHRFLRPTGRLFLVLDPNGRLVGCGTLHQVRPDAAEVKRLYIRPEAAGHGLGRALVEAWIDAAREIGFSKLLVNVINTNRAPLRIFDALGFQYIDRYAECADPIEVDPYFVYLEYEVT